jgi:molecular chaperone GrpE
MNPPHSNDSPDTHDSTDSTPTGNGHSEPTSVPDEETQRELQRLQGDVADLKDKYVRTVAEMENMRRRMERERADVAKFALESIFKDFLPVLDSLERALPDDVVPAGSNGKGHGDGAGSSYLEGLLMTKRQLLDVLRKHGLEEIKAAGTAFDPNLHQAIQRIDSPDVDVESVGSEFARGYLLHGRLLRPAMVSVLMPSNT